jgi:hypothetical protein
MTLGMSPSIITKTWYLMLYKTFIISVQSISVTKNHGSHHRSYRKLPGQVILI